MPVLKFSAFVLAVDFASNVVISALSVAKQVDGVVVVSSFTPIRPAEDVEEKRYRGIA
jgi:hypothetical protein